MRARQHVALNTQSSTILRITLTMQIKTLATGIKNEGSNSFPQQSHLGNIQEFELLVKLQLYKSVPITSEPADTVKPGGNDLQKAQEDSPSPVSIQSGSSTIFTDNQKLVSRTSRTNIRNPTPCSYLPMQPHSTVQTNLKKCPCQLLKKT